MANGVLDLNARWRAGPAVTTQIPGLGGRRLIRLGEIEEMPPAIFDQSTARGAILGERCSLDLHDLLTTVNGQIGQGIHLRPIETFAVFG